MLRSLLRLLTVQTVPHDLPPTTASRCRGTHPGGVPSINRARECRSAPNPLPSNAGRSRRWSSGLTVVIDDHRSRIDVVIVQHGPGCNHPRTRLLQASTNKGEKKGRSPKDPGPHRDNRLEWPLPAPVHRPQHLVGTVDALALTYVRRATPQSILPNMRIRAISRAANWQKRGGGSGRPDPPREESSLGARPARRRAGWSRRLRLSPRGGRPPRRPRCPPPRPYGCRPPPW